VFKRLTQRGLAAHLTWLLEQESISFEPAAVNLLARRGAGSVRDAMSLLSQVLALGTAGLALKDVREVLGLADQELYLDLLRALAAQDLLGINRVLNAVLDNGLDLIFFLRELVLCWRNLFLLTQLGEQAKELIDLPEEEIVAWQGCVPLFSLPHIHACWQMTLEGQRKVQTSLDPGLDLEMLLLNLAYLPSLLPLGKVTTSSAPAGSPPHPVRSTPAVSAAQSAAAPKQERRPAPAPRPVASMDERFVGDPGVQGSGKTPSVPVSSPSSPVECLSVQEPPAASLQPSAPKALSDTTPRDWPGFVDYCLSRQQQTGQSFIFLKQAKATLEGNQIRIACTTDFLYQKFSGREADRVLKELSREFFGSQAEIILEPPQANAYTTATEVKQQALNDPLVKDVMDTFGAQIVDVQPRREPSQS
jgi:DNA polymerase-3 subunit gamma/tau